MSCKNILVIEHDERTIELLKDKLNQHDQILLIPLGKRAIQIAKEGQFDVAIISQCLPDINGLEVLEKFKMRCPSLPIIFIADAPIENLINSASQLGAKHVFEKPINENYFLACIKNAMKSGDSGKDECHSIKHETELGSDIQKFYQHWHIAWKTEREKGLDVAINEYEQAAALYKEDLVIEGVCENWTELDRDNIEEIFLFILNKLSYYYWLDEKTDAAISLCNKILNKDNCREDVHQRLMKCYCKIGQWDNALKQYQNCVEVLKLKLQVEPMNSTVQLYEQIKQNLKNDMKN